MRRYAAVYRSQRICQHCRETRLEMLSITGLNQFGNGRPVSRRHGVLWPAYEAGAVWRRSG